MSIYIIIGLALLAAWWAWGWVGAPDYGPLWRLFGAALLFTFLTFWIVLIPVVILNIPLTF